MLRISVIPHCKNNTINIKTLLLLLVLLVLLLLLLLLLFLSHTYVLICIIGI